MLKKWLKNSILFTLFIGVSVSFSQIKTDTLRTFTKSEFLTDLESFSSLTLTDSSQFKTLAEVLETSSPVYLKNYGKGQLATLSIRGNGASQTQLFWNGFKMNSPTLGQSDLSLIPTFFISDFELNYSGGSSVNGSGGIGGSLDLSNKLNWKKGLHGSYGKQLGSFSQSTSRYQVSFGTKKFYQQVKFLTKKGENDFSFPNTSKINNPTENQTNNKLWQWGGQYEIGYIINTKNIIQATAIYFDSWREIPPINGGVSNEETQEDKIFRGFVSWKSYQDKFKSDLRVSFFNEKLNYIDSISSIFSEVEVNTYQAQQRLKFKVLKNFDVETSIQNSLAVAMSSGFDESKRRNEAGVYVKISETLKKGYYEVFARQELIDSDFSPVVFGGGFIYNPFNNNVKFKGNISSNYRVPTLNDLYWAQGGNSSLLPENGWSAEVGVDFEKVLECYSCAVTTNDVTVLSGKLYENRFNFGLTAFYNQTENWIQWTPTDFGYWSPSNVKQIENKGIEVVTSFYHEKNSNKIEAKINYSFTHSRNKDFLSQNNEIVNRIPIYIPTHKANTYLSYSINRLTLFYSQLYNGRVFIDESNSTYLPHYFPANTGLSYSNSLKNIKYVIRGRINNVFNEPYQVVANRPIPGRNYSINLTLSF